jgi:TonB family protein
MYVVLPVALIGIVVAATSETAAGPALENQIRREAPRQDPEQRVTEPVYPRDLAENGVEGSVILSFRVLSDGTVAADSIKVEESSGNARLDAAAKAEAATRWRFLPATENGVPVESDHKFRVVFSLAHAGGGVMEMPAEDFPGSLKDDGELYVPLNMGLDGR